MEEKKRFLIHDLPSGREEMLKKFAKADQAAVAQQTPLFCTGCFGCWLKTPGRCVLPDSYQSMGKRLSEAEEVYIVSRLDWGGPSPAVKAVLDRSIGYLHPDFAIVGGEMHHQPRYDHRFRVHFRFYGPDITEEERSCAKAWAASYGINFYADVAEVSFVSEVEQWEGWR